MKATEIERLVKQYLLPKLPGFDASRALLISSPIQWLLRGFAFDSSGLSPKAFTVWAFFQPLYVPREHVWLNFGHRLGTLHGGQEKWWNLEDAPEPVVMQEVQHLVATEGLPFLFEVRDPTDLASRGAGLAVGTRNLNVQEATAYSLILAHRYEDARQALLRLSADIKSMDPRMGWPGQIADRSDRLLALLDSDPNAAVATLWNWRSQTLKALRLSSDWQPGSVEPT